MNNGNSDIQSFKNHFQNVLDTNRFRCIEENVEQKRYKINVYKNKYQMWKAIRYWFFL